MSVSGITGLGASSLIQRSGFAHQKHACLTRKEGMPCLFFPPAVVLRWEGCQSPKLPSVLYATVMQSSIDRQPIVSSAGYIF